MAKSRRVNNERQPPSLDDLPKEGTKQEFRSDDSDRVDIYQRLANEVRAVSRDPTFEDYQLEFRPEALEKFSKLRKLSLEKTVRKAFQNFFLKTFTILNDGPPKDRGYPNKMWHRHVSNNMGVGEYLFVACVREAVRDCLGRAGDVRDFQLREIGFPAIAGPLGEYHPGCGRVAQLFNDAVTYFRHQEQCWQNALGEIAKKLVQGKLVTGRRYNREKMRRAFDSTMPRDFYRLNKGGAHYLDGAGYVRVQAAIRQTGIVDDNKTQTKTSIREYLKIPMMKGLPYKSTADEAIDRDQLMIVRSRSVFAQADLNDVTDYVALGTAQPIGIVNAVEDVGDNDDCEYLISLVESYQKVAAGRIPRLKISFADIAGMIYADSEHSSCGQLLLDEHPWIRELGKEFGLSRKMKLSQLHDIRSLLEARAFGSMPTLSQSGFAIQPRIVGDQIGALEYFPMGLGYVAVSEDIK